jgi:Protein of unknown function (DUF3040)
MSLSHRQQHQLYRIESRLFRSDPQLAAMLATFTKLSADQRLPSWEQVATRLDRIRQAAALIAMEIAAIVVAIGVLVGAVLALLTAIIMGSRARPPQPARQQTGLGTDGRSDQAI